MMACIITPAIPQGDKLCVMSPKANKLPSVRLMTPEKCNVYVVAQQKFIHFLSPFHFFSSNPPEVLQNAKNAFSAAIERLLQHILVGGIKPSHSCPIKVI